MWWSEAGWLSHPSASSRTLASSNHVGCFIAGYTVVTFRNSFRGRPVESSNLFATSRKTAAKFSEVHLPLKQRVSRTLLHSALSWTIKWALCVANDWVAHELCCVTHRWWAPHQRLPTLSGDTSFPPWHVHVGKQGEMLAAVCDGTLYSGWRKESSRRKAVSATTEAKKAVLGSGPCRRSTSLTASRSTTHALIESDRSRSPAPWLVIKDKSRLIARQLAISDLFCFVPCTQAYSFTRYDAPKTNRLLR